MSYAGKSPWVIHIEGAGCRACGDEVRACRVPMYEAEKAGIRFTDDPGMADVLLVTGVIDSETAGRVSDTYGMMLSPKRIVAAGACACTGGAFSMCESVVEGLDAVTGTDVYIPGCAATPQQVIEGILKSFDEEAQEEEPYEEESGSEEADKEEKDDDKAGQSSGDDGSADDGKSEDE